MNDAIAVLAPLFALLLATGGVAYLGYILLQVVQRKLLGDAVDADGLAELRDRVAELEEIVGTSAPQGDQRLTELEERVDFAERLLASQHEPAELPEQSGDTMTPH